VVGEIGRGTQREQLALGDTLNLAARLQTIADPGALVLSGVTDRLIARRFVCQRLGTRSLKGLGIPLT
jgi:class 3 adenylate cyclase